VRSRDARGSNGRRALHRADGDIGAAQPLGEAAPFSTNLHPGDAGGLDSVLDGDSPRVSILGNIPPDEERKEGLGDRLLPPDHAPTQRVAARLKPRTFPNRKPEAGGDAFQILDREAPSAKPIAIREAVGERAAEPMASCLLSVHDREELDVGTAQRNDAIRGTPAWMFASRVRAEAQPPFQPLGGDVQVPHPEDDMVQARHAGSLRTAATTFIAIATALAATIGPHTLLNASDRIL
jgi:hypothetical protein